VLSIPEPCHSKCSSPPAKPSMLKSHAADSQRLRELTALILASNVTKSSNSSGQAGASSSGVYPISYNWLSGSAEENKKERESPEGNAHPQLKDSFGRHDSSRTRTSSCTHQCLRLSERTSASRHPTTTSGGRQLGRLLPGRAPTRPLAAPMGLAPGFIPILSWSPFLFLVSPLSPFPASSYSSPRRL